MPIDSDKRMKTHKSILILAGGWDWKIDGKLLSNLLPGFLIEKTKGKKSNRVADIL